LLGQPVKTGSSLARPGILLVCRPRIAIFPRADRWAGHRSRSVDDHRAPTSDPLGPARDRATVRFEIYRQDNGVWRLAARRDVAADATGRASLRWTFVTTGSRYVRAKALANATYAASPWSSLVRYTVR
jgi:hypothetical protein